MAREDYSNWLCDLKDQYSPPDDLEIWTAAWNAALEKAAKDFELLGITEGSEMIRALKEE